MKPAEPLRIEARRRRSTFRFPYLSSTHRDPVTDAADPMLLVRVAMSLAWGPPEFMGLPFLVQVSVTQAFQEGRL